MKSSDSRPRGRDCLNRVAKGHNPSTVHLLSRPTFYLILFIVALGCAGLWWIFNGRGATRPTVPIAQRHAQIASVTPAVARTNVAAVAAAPKPEIPYWEVDASQTNGFTREMMHKWRDKHAPPPGHVYKSVRKKSKWHIFNHKSENLIASLLRFKPGKTTIGRMNFHNLNEDFLKSCEEPITVSPDDDEYTASLKRDMNAAKIELKSRIDAGEDLAAIIEETRDEYRKLAQFKRSIEREVRELAEKQAKTSEDIDAFEAAANKMLEEKGIAPMKFTPITREFLLNVKKEDDL